MFLLVDKPKGITSHDVVDLVRKITGITKVGHGGTLDPNATGLLIIGIGRESTKRLAQLSLGATKTYLAEIFLGESRDTDDVEGEKIPNSIYKIPNITQLTKVQITKTLNSFLGEQLQTPPQFSAIKSKGQKAYDVARQGITVELEPRKITIRSITLVKYNYPVLKINCDVSSGTYIRSLARDIGVKLGCGAYLEDLRRTKIGEYDIANAVKLNQLTAANWREFEIEL